MLNEWIKGRIRKSIPGHKMCIFKSTQVQISFSATKITLLWLISISLHWKGKTREQGTETQLICLKELTLRNVYLVMDNNFYALLNNSKSDELQEKSSGLEWYNTNYKNLARKHF